ncbi:iron-containing redox enzyme family protein [Mangrovihabitans endophyticus]|uniref:Iron-containing redox enzyme n=1 Tax=Mangrovihabitans endophyticus TaxID=1751298 RepID=A0A8J3BSB7_9ACTN|nr:iron-containing redox enzyme family protein [Mangrovihabitans endophyticus]GGK72766.1 hypothetical protein GCM10012284_03320 [Mangrovihabitans endophyticus]
MHDDASVEGADSVFRRVYARSADPEASIPGGDLVELVRSELRRVAADPARSLDELTREAADWSAATAERFEAIDEAACRDNRRLAVRRAALGWAPLGVASGAWLQWMTSPGNADAMLPLRALALYASDIGVGRPGAARGGVYLDLLRHIHASEYAVPLARLAGDTRIADSAFRLPAVLLLMSRRPDDFRPEIVGADLCLRAVGFPPPLAIARAEIRADWSAIDYSCAGNGGAPATQQCRVIADALIQDGPESKGSVYAGFGWALATLRETVESLHADVTASLDPGYAMAELMGLRAREASVYHGQVMLEDRPLSAWLRDCRGDPRPFLAVLARSRLIKPGNSATSPLVTGMIGERGPMFRIFSPDDLAVIRRWIDALPSSSPVAAGAVTVPAAATHAVGQHRLAPLSGLLAAEPPPGPCPTDTRGAYHLLMSRAGGPALDNWSLRYVRGWLARSRYGVDRRTGPLPPHWTTEGLRPWLQAQHDRHSNEFEASADAPPPSREAVIDDAIQTAPLTLIDGSWLQGFTDYELAPSEIGFSLFATYWDELGNGEPRLNHPLIYREVLHEMGVDLPPTSSLEFARWPGFRNESFELPVYWLCIGRYPRTFLPELLGLNLAMELSGVGGAYRRARVALREYGFSTRFVDIHNTIDNVATGHSAWAADAVDTFMSALPDSSGPSSRPEVWERVRTGYRSLSPPAGPLARWAGRRASRTRQRSGTTRVTVAERGDA